MKPEYRSNSVQEAGFPNDGLLLNYHEQNPPMDHLGCSWRGFSAEHFEITGQSAYDFALKSARAYLALHDMIMIDGEIRIGAASAVRRLDISNRLTYVPPGVAVTGWNRLENRKNSFTAIYFDPAIIPQELETSVQHRGEPRLYFQDQFLQATLLKIEAIVARRLPSLPIYAETLILAAIIELSISSAQLPSVAKPVKGGLSVNQQKLVVSYINDHLDQKLTLDELARLVNLSRFHFARAFKASMGVAPHNFVLQCRIARAKLELAEKTISVQQIAATHGFGSARQFSTIFRKVVGCSPIAFRRSS